MIAKLKCFQCKEAICHFVTSHSIDLAVCCSIGLTFLECPQLRKSLIDCIKKFASRFLLLLSLLSNSKNQRATKVDTLQKHEFIDTKPTSMLLLLLKLWRCVRVCATVCIYVCCVYYWKSKTAAVEEKKKKRTKIDTIRVGIIQMNSLI